MHKYIHTYIKIYKKLQCSKYLLRKGLGNKKLYILKPERIKPVFSSLFN